MEHWNTPKYGICAKPRTEQRRHVSTNAARNPTHAMKTAGRTAPSQGIDGTQAPAGLIKQGRAAIQKARCVDVTNFFLIITSRPSTWRPAAKFLLIYIAIVCGGYGVSSQDFLDVAPKKLGLYPSVVNLAAHARIDVNATCGENGPEYFCRLVEHNTRLSRRRKRSQCETCSSRSINPNDRHEIEFAIDGRGDRWWQSPTINNGYEYHWVTITLDLKQIFQVAYVILKAANSPRPGNWVLERSLDGVAWQPWQYFAVSNSECRQRYPARTTSMGSPKLRYDSEVVCTSYFSQLLPLRNGEIHISMVNGRPTAENPSSELINFTSARYIRFRFQKIRTLHGDLMTIANNPEDQVDPSVTRRYFYSVKDISIGGMCICYGHAHDCPSSPTSNKFVCKCEHNTSGDSCEQCLPKFNQLKWSPGNNGFQCEECNCHGHADSCYYDENVELRKESINMRGIRKGGGVCVGCKDNTAGINCDSCIDGFYRPINLRPEDEIPCRPCVCDSFGSRSTVDGKMMCRKSTNDGGAHRGMMPGDCYCKNGYAGQKCDRCDFGFRGYPNCTPCPCNAAGSLNADPCDGECVCKENVEGVKCDQCKRGYFNLDRKSPVGCEECFCYGVTDVCNSALLFRSTVRNLNGWEIQDRSGSHRALAGYDADLREPYASHNDMSRAVCTGLYYWSAPEDYIGNKLSSYGGDLRYTIYYELPSIDDPSATLIQDVDVVMEGNDLSLEFSRHRTVEPYVDVSFIIPLEVGAGWIEPNSRLPATKAQLLEVLSEIKRLLIRASYNQNAKSVFRIRDVSLDIATSDGPGEPVASVEQCHCPRGFTGYSCEQCAPGYRRDGMTCVQCKCHGHADTCNLYGGACKDCKHNTMGINCERCQNGYYGDATRGTAHDCRRCACPLPDSSNNFSPTCTMDEFDSAITCLNCPPGYEGRRCQRCSDGYYGDPMILGDRCLPCQCHGNAATCDKGTGVCTACQDHTAGQHCERCATGYYGDAISRKDCRACSCDTAGSYSNRCDLVTGQCICRPGISGRRCDSCQYGEFLDRVRKECVSCGCNTQGSVNSRCDSRGACICKVGVSGEKCDQCSRGYYGFGADGCETCDCDHTNQYCDPDTGACLCPPLTTGPKCTQCAPNSFGWSPDNGCEECNCDAVGSKNSQCDVVTGKCACKDEYAGQHCSLCRNGYFDFPDCLPCACHLPGTEPTSCDSDTECSCTNTGQCKCKENVIGTKCQRCVAGSFSMQLENPKGCTECFCFGVTDQCRQAVYHWGDAVSLRANMQVMVANQINTRSTSEGVVMSKNAGLVTMDTSVVRRSMRYEPYYWRLPPQFNGDKLTSYGGKLRFTIYYAAQVGSSLDEGEANVVIRGRHNATTIAYKLVDPLNKQSKGYEVAMRESGWTYLGTNKPVSRQDFAMVLSNIDFFLIKASYGQLMDQSRLSDVFLDVAVKGSGGRGDSSSSGNPALGVEQCICPPGYTGLSCQNCAIGYMRVRSGPYLGKCKPCACNGKSDICDVNTGICVGCNGNFTGDHCDRCVTGFYLASGPTGPVCRKCACPLPEAENNFSPTCRPSGADGLDGFICDACPVGYEGVHCERCSTGYFGAPAVPGGYCKKCGCNPSGSISTGCDTVTGKCVCKPGIAGRVCDQCRPRHAITEDGCIACDDECSGRLLDDLEELKNRTASVDMNNLFPPPWDKLMQAENRTNGLTPYLKILVHRRRNYEASRCLSLKDKLDESMTYTMNTMMIIVKITPEINKMNKTLNHLNKKSKTCYLNGDDMSYVANRTQRKADKKVEKAKSVLKDAEGLSSRMKRILDRLLDGTAVDDAEIVSKVSELISTLRDRDLSMYQDIADEELRLARNLLSRVNRRFTDRASDVIRNYKKGNQEIDDRLKIVNEKLEDLLQKALAAQTMVEETRKINNMNNVTIGQLKADLETTENEIQMVEDIIQQTKNIINQTETKIGDIRNYIEDLKVRADKLSELTMGQLKQESDKVSANQAKLGPLRLLVMMAEEHKKELVQLANYFEEVLKNVSGISYNQTDAATRYSRIADIIREANESANSALEKSMNAEDLAKGNLSEIANEMLLEAMDLMDEVNGMKSDMKKEKQRLRGVKNQTRLLNTTANDLRKKFKRVKKRVSNLDTALLPDPKNITKISKEAMKISDEVLAGVKDLEGKAKDLKDAVDVASRYGEIIGEIKDDKFWLDSVPILLGQAYLAMDNARDTKTRFELSSDVVRRRIDDIRKQIEESRKKAASIREASVKSSGKCTMRYKPDITPGRVTDVVLQAIINSGNNTLFYLGRDDDDYILVETSGGKVHVSWNLGSGAKKIENPVDVLTEAKKDVKEDWYRIELHRQDQEMNVTVYRIVDKDGTIQTVSGSSPGDSTVLNVDERGYLYVGGVDSMVKPEIPVRSFVGCMGEAYLQGKSIGLWNFREISDTSACEGCLASPQKAATGSVYSYDGNSYTVLQQTISRSPSNINILDFEFKTFSSNGLLLYKGSSTTSDFSSVELENGRIIARIDLGNGINFLKTNKTYNNGKWVKLYFRRLDGKVQLTIMPEDGVNEVIRIQIAGSDNHLNMTSKDLTCVGGCPPEIVMTAPIQRTGYVGCLKDMKIYAQSQPLSGSGTNVIRYSGVASTCPSKISHNIGIDDGGFVEIEGYDFSATGSVSISFNSREPDALLLLATNDVASGRRKRRQSEKNFYSLSLSGGYVVAHLRGSSGSVIILKSSSSIYSDGDEHVAILRRQNGRVHLEMDDGDDQVGDSMANGVIATSRVFVGGVPKSFDVKGLAASDNSLNGCVRELVTDGLVDFSNARRAVNSYVGSCVFFVTAVTTLPPLTSSTPRETRSSTTISPTPHIVTPTAISSSCVAQGELPTLRSSAVHFGRSSHSHQQFAFSEKIDTKFRIEITVRTFASHGLLLYARHDTHNDFFSLQLKNGMPVFRFDIGKGVGATVGNFSVNDGYWHTIRISRSKRKGYLKVDNMRYVMVKSPRGANRMDVTPVLYVGGLPEKRDTTRLTGSWQSPDACVRSILINKNKLDLRKADASNKVELCYEQVEEGAYFDGTGYAIYDDRYRVGPDMQIELEFRTWARDGVLLSISDRDRGDGLALEMVNGSIFFRVNNGAGNIFTEYTPKSGLLGVVALCDGEWHKIKATKEKSSLTLHVDELVGTGLQTSAGGQNSADTKDPLYIGGIPDDASEQQQLVTNMKFRGCMRNVKLKGQTVDFSRIHEYHDISPNSCAKAKG